MDKMEIRKQDNKTMMQYFEWYLPSDGTFWNFAASEAKDLKKNGIDMVWLPPAYKGSSAEDVGYGVYDMYDLGEFDQKGTVRTKYGTAKEYETAVKKLHAAGVEVIPDVVLNHRMGADYTEEVRAIQVEYNDRERTEGEEKTICAWTGFNFPGRKDKYSAFHWTKDCFSGTDWDEATKSSGIYRFAGKQWNRETDPEMGGFDYLMGADLDTDRPEVVQETLDWGKWYFDRIKPEGVRLDAVKHISFAFYKHWLAEMRKHCGKDFFAVGEYWSPDLGRLTHYLDATEHAMCLFDVPLHFRLERASKSGGNYDMGSILNDTLVKVDPDAAVTFVDNHDTEPGQALQSFVDPWFKPIAYALILLRQQGLPCVFYGDYYGIPSQNVGPVAELPRLLALRKQFAYGQQIDYFDDQNIVGWTRQGDGDHPHSGMAVLLSDGAGGVKNMDMGKTFANTEFVDAMGRCTDIVTTDENGVGLFEASGGSVSVWVTKEAAKTVI